MEAYREGQADLRRYRRAIARARERMRAGGGAATTPCYADVCLGRDAELQAIGEWFRTPNAPLLTLIGKSGIGKTHLACSFSKRAQAAGVPCVYVNLTLLAHADQILPSLFHTLDLPFPAEGVWQRIAARLFAGDELIVLDDFDRLLPDGAAYVQALLDTAPNAKILATSQEPLGLAVEQTLLLSPLPIPPDTRLSIPELLQYPSVALVLQQAGERFQLTPQRAHRLVQACVASGGHPSHLVRLGLCLHQNPDAVWKPQTPQRCLTNMLREEEQRILRCLLVFVDSFDTKAAAAAAQVSPDAMKSFLDAMRKRGFLQWSADRQRYRIHPQVRPTIPPLTEAQRQAVMERLHTHYMQRLQQMYATQPFSQTRQWCFQGQNNLRSVLDYLATHRLYPALAEFLGLLTLACAERPPAMLLDWGVAQITKLVDIPDETRAALAYAVFAALVDSGENAKAKQLTPILEGSPRYAPFVARFWHNMGEGNRARRHYEQAFIRAESDGVREEAVRYAAELAEIEAVVGNLREAETILRDIDRRHNVSRMSESVRSWFHYVGGYLNYQRGRFRRSRELYEKSAALGVHANNAYRELSRVYLELGDYDRAEQYVLAGLQHFEGDPEPVLPSLHALNACLGDLYAVRERYDDALQRHLPALDFWRKEGQPRWICWSLNRIAEIELLARDANDPWRLTHRIERDAHALLHEAWAVIEPTYRNLPHKSRTLHNLGWLAWHEGRLDEAEQYLTRALEIRQDYGNEYGVARTLELLARLRFRQHRYAEARALFQQASDIRLRLDAKPYPAVKSANLSVHRKLQTLRD
jgi:tetratricopeptide (TPR) repeat protein/Cdc6-like AAA superfamily ATPase